ncbi:MAG: putative oxidoreductase [Chloroflexi bacterium]|nr:putative oxidoreductase [Chloroflexota bacterium]
MSASDLDDFDAIIIGSGAGGSTLAYGLRDSGARVLVIERGDFLPQEAENWSVEAVFEHKRYKPAEKWQDARTGGWFQPGVHYFVGGNTKVFGAAFPRFRREDFEALQHYEGVSPAWPISYDDLEPYYAQAERLYRVHGSVGQDPTEPARSSPYPYPPVPHEPYVETLAASLAALGVHPFDLPMGIDLRTGGACIRCKTCDGFPCRVQAKSDAEVCALRPALQTGQVHLLTRAFARRLLTDTTGTRVLAVEIDHRGAVVNIQAPTIIISCGAVNSAALLLRSATEKHPAGLANSSGLVGRNYMVHNNTAMTAVHPVRRNDTMFQKTFAINDFYLGSDDWPHPMGNIQLLGKLQAGMLSASGRMVPRPLLQWIASRSVDFWIMSEDLPNPDNRVTVDGKGRIKVHWRPNNTAAHIRLVRNARRLLRNAGYPFIATQRMGIETNSHQCGTLRFGHDPTTSVLDPYCRAHDLENLFVVDGSFFPSSTATNPALTITAQALRVTDHLRRTGVVG